MAFDPDSDDEELDNDETALASDDEDGGDEDDAEGDDSEQDRRHPHGRPQAGIAQAWEIILAERDADGEWHTVGEPVPDAHFETLDVAQAYEEARNRRQFGRRFDWMADPSKAWVAVRIGQRGRLRGMGQCE